MVEQQNVSGNYLGLSVHLALEIGDKLRQAREKNRLSFSQICMRTKIREQYLHAIEEGRWDELPGGLHGRGLIRNYARELMVSVPELEPQNIKEFTKSFEQPHPQMVREGAGAPTRKTLAEARKKPETFTRGRAARPVHTPPLSTPVPRKSQHDDIVTPDLHEILGLRLNEEAPVPEQPQESFHSQRVEHSSSEDDLDEVVLPQPEPIPDDAFQVSMADSVAPIAAQPSIPPVMHPEPVFEPTIAAPEVPETPVRSVPAAESSYELPTAAPMSSEVTELIPAAGAVPAVPAKMTSLKPKYFVYATLVFVTLVVGVGIVRKKMRSDVNPGAVPAADSAAEMQPETEIVSKDPVPNSTPRVEEPVPQASAPEVSAPTAKPEESAASEAPQIGKPSEATSAATPPSETTTSAGPKQAKLEVLEEVQLRIAVDGKVLFQGTKPKGPFVVDFKDRAELYVQDGSKVSMVYDGWDHGVLGQPGRKRRIVLKASSYEAN